MNHSWTALRAFALLLTAPLAGFALNLQVAESDRLSEKPGLSWHSSAPQTVEVLQNGCVIGLQPGSATVTASDGSSFDVTVTPPSTELADVANIKQYPDNRSFSIDGRKCFGCELNGQRAISAEEKRFTHANRIINPHPLGKKHNLDWEVKPNAEIFDGAGVLIGTVAPALKVDGRMATVSMFNFGASKVLHGRICVYAFSVPVKPSPAVRGLASAADLKKGRVDTSAWMPLDDVVDKEEFMDRDVLGKAKLPALPLEAAGFRVTGGNPGQYVTPAGELTIVHVVPSELKGAPPVPSHYLRRPSGTVNLIYSVPGFGLGGEGTDSFLVSDHVKFYPAIGVRTFKQPTYYPRKDPRMGKAAAATMTFVYGAVKMPGAEPVYGWIAREALAE